MRIVLALIISLALASNASAQHFWAGGALGSATDEWVASGTTNQWASATLAGLAPPGAADAAFVLNHVTDGINLLPYPHIRTDVGSIDLLVLAPNDDATAELTIETGGRLVVSGATHLGQNQGGAGNSFGTIDITGGQMVTTDLLLGANVPTGAGQVNIDGGFLHAGTVTFFDNANVDIEHGAFFHLNGDRSAEVQGWIDSGFITANDGTTNLDWAYNGSTLTSIWAVPEPTSMVLLALGGFMLAPRRRK